MAYIEVRVLGAHVRLYAYASKGGGNNVRVGLKPDTAGTSLRAK